MWRVYKRNSVYWIDVRVDSKRVRKSAKTTERKSAQDLARIEESKLLGTYHEAQKQTVGGAIAVMLQAKTDSRKSAGTLDFYSTKCGHLVRIFGEHTALTDIDARAIDSYVAQRRSERASSNTISKELIAIRQILRHARRRDEYDREPSQVMPVGFSAEYKPRDKYLTPDQVSRLVARLEVNHPDVAAWVAFALASAARRSELSRVLREDVSLSEHTIKIRGTKTEESDATIPIVGVLRPLVEYALAHGRHHGRLLPSWGRVRKVLATALDGMEFTASPNDFRRTTATWLAQSGVPLEHVSKLLRHADTRMVERVYARVTPEALGKLIDSAAGVPRVYPTGWTSQTARTIQTAENPDDSRAQGQDRTDHTRIFSPVRSGKNTDDFARFSAGVSYLYLDLYLARRARDLSQSDTVAQSLSEAIEGALAADEAKTIGAMLRCGRALRWIEKVAS